MVFPSSFEHIHRLHISGSILSHMYKKYLNTNESSREAPQHSGYCNQPIGDVATTELLKEETKGKRNKMR